MRVPLASMVLVLTVAASAAWASQPMAHGSSMGIGPHRHPIVHHPLQRRFIPQFAYPLDYYGDNWGYAPAPAFVAAEPPPPSTPVAITHYERPTVETTPEGVTIVRGPGSHRPMQ